MRLYPDLDRLRFPLVAKQADLAIHEAHEMLHTVQNRLKLQLNS